MGHYKRNGVECFTPDDTDTKIYLPSSDYQYLGSIIKKIKDKWGDDANLDDFVISAEYIHTECLYYDRYDPSDYENFIVIEYDPVTD